MGSLKKFDGSSWINSNLRKLTTDTDTFTTFPAIIYAEGTNATVGLKGNTVQSSTPTPDSPVMPQGTGERTGNLAPPLTEWVDGYVSASGAIAPPTENYKEKSSDYIPVKVGREYTFSVGNEFPGGTYYPWRAIGWYTQDKTFISRDAGNAGGALSTSAPSNAVYCRLSYRTHGETTNPMLNLGSTPLPYEPYGYKIPISSANTTTPVYLGEVQTTRKIKKLVLTGEESWSENTSGTNTFCGTMPLSENNMNYTPGFCTHVEYVTTGVSRDMELVGCLNSNIYLRLSRAIVNTLAGFKSYLSAQYTAGTPVTVWYVLATEETAVVNEPLMKIGDYADTVSGISIPVTAGGDTLSVGTTIQPSEVTANYYGWHTITVHERESGQWD